MKNENLNVYENEIPVGSRLYFGKSATLKRQIEQKASEILTSNGFSEILTPFFSYHQHLSVSPTELLRFSDHSNHEISLRGDSTIDVVRIVRARLKDALNKKWFYIQPVFRYPSTEIYQIGAEIIGEIDLANSVKMVKSLLDEFSFDAILQLSNIKIPKMIAKILNIDIDIFEKIQLEKILALNINWLSKLALLNTKDELDEIINLAPNELKNPLNELKNLAVSIDYKNLRLVPLYYSKMRYYDSLFFRFLKANSILAGGGNYEINGEISSGFAIYTDALIENQNTRREI